MIELKKLNPNRHATKKYLSWLKNSDVKRFTDLKYRKFSIQKIKESILIRVLIQIRSFSLQNWQMRRFELLATRPRSCSRQNGRLFGLPDSSIIAAVNLALCVEDTTPVALLELQLRPLKCQDRLLDANC